MLNKEQGDRLKQLIKEITDDKDRNTKIPR